MARTNPTPCFVPGKGELIPHPGRQIKHVIVTTGRRLHLPPFAISPPQKEKKIPLRIGRVADGQNVFRSRARQMERVGARAWTKRWQRY